MFGYKMANSFQLIIKQCSAAFQGSPKTHF